MDRKHSGCKYIKTTTPNVAENATISNFELNCVRVFNSMSWEMTTDITYSGMVHRLRKKSYEISKF